MKTYLSDHALKKRSNRYALPSKRVSGWCKLTRLIDELHFGATEQAISTRYRAQSDLLSTNKTGGTTVSKSSLAFLYGMPGTFLRLKKTYKER